MTRKPLSSDQKNELTNNFDARLNAFYQGALLVIGSLPKSTQDLPTTETTPLVSKENKAAQILAKYQKFIQNFKETDDPKKLKMALAIYMQELAEACNISVKDVQRGEAYWAWQTSSTRTKTLRGTTVLEKTDAEKTSKVAVTVTETFIPLELTKAQKQELLKTLIPGEVPKWFSKRAPWEQNALRSDLRVALGLTENQTIKESEVEGLTHNTGWNTFTERSIPATLKWLPIVGVSEHVLTVNGQLSKAYRTSIPVPYDAVLKEQQRLTDMNMAQIAEGLSKPHGKDSINRNIVLVSLITGGKSEGWLSFIGLRLIELFKTFKENNARWVSMEDKAIPEEDKTRLSERETIPSGQVVTNNITHYNFGINSFRSATPVKISQDYIDNLTDQQLTDQQLPDDSTKKNPFKEALITHNQKIDGLSFYEKSILSKKYDRNPNLFSAALIDAAERWEGGISAGHCKSTKDRKGIELLIADTIIVYQQLYNKLPAYDDEGEDRKNFLTIACSLYQTGIYADVAAFHSPGSKGLKDDGFTPKDLKEALADDYKLSKIQASWNKPKSESRMSRDILLTIGAVITPLGILCPPLFFVGAGLLLAATINESKILVQKQQLKKEIKQLQEDNTTGNTAPQTPGL